MPPHQTGVLKKSRFLKTFMAVLTVIFLLLLVLLFVLLYSAPFFAVKAGQRWYEAQGEGYQLRVADWQFAPFRTELTLTGIELKHPPEMVGDGVDDGATAAISRLETVSLNIDPWALFSHEIDIRDIRLEGLRLNAYLQYDDAMRVLVSGLTIPMSGEEAADNGTPHSAADDMPESKGASIPWRIRLGRLTLTDEIINWQQDALPLQDTDNPNNRVTSPATQGQVKIQSLQAGPFDSVAAAVLPLSLELELTRFGLQAEKPLHLQQPLTLTLNGQLNDVMTAPQWAGDMTLDNVSISVADAPPLAFKRLQLTHLLAGADAQSLEMLSLEQFRLGSEEQPLLQLGHYKISDISSSPAQLVTGLHEYDDLQLAIQRLADGAIHGLPKAHSTENEQTPMRQTAMQKNMQTEPAASAAFSIFIAGVQQNGDSSGAEIADAVVNPAFNGRVQIRELNIGEISAELSAVSGQPELLKPLQLHAVLSLDDYNRMALDASLTLANIQNTASHDAAALYPQGNVTLRISQLDMVAFNGYLAQAMGYHLEKGMLNLDVDMDMQQARLGGEVRVLLRNSRFVPENEETIKRFSKQISMPVDTALDLLRDDNGNVRLTVPVSGDMTSPDFGTGDITAQLSRLALQSAAMHYLKQSLQPYGLLLSIASYAGSELMAIRLDALTFAENEDVINDEQMLHLQKVAQLMYKKTELELQVCPFVSNTEANMREKDWPALARQRGAAIKAWLAQQTDAEGESLAPRITLCKPQQGEKAEVVLGFN
ncbi:MAG: DUF748 domain-containing protein [Saccharospirillaceae bacterium]|nr:DUF748 domain-containing protein [Saccharospirillaceae bacterium]MCD8532540.1 DUF748 domain-containing protein [Saccharospirillaceae bacterium]